MWFMSRQARRMVVVVLVATAVLGASDAGAADSHAPAGAPDRWLPDDEWVMSGWAPIDETRLQHLTGITRDELSGWLDNHRSLGRLVRAHGVRDLRAFAVTLTEPQCAARFVGASPASTSIDDVVAFLHSQPTTLTLHER